MTQAFGLSRAWRWLRPPMASSALTGSAHARAAQRAWSIVHAVYAYNVYIGVTLLKNWQRWADGPVLDPLWPVSWVTATGSAAAGILVGTAYLGTSLLALFRPERRGARALCAASALMAFALHNSFGKINHTYHGLLWVLIIFVFLPQPDGQTHHARRRFRQQTLRIFWAGQAALLMFYSMSGALKLYASINQMAKGQAGFLSAEAAARHVAHRLLQTNGESLLGWLMLDHPWLGLPTQWLTIYLELLAFLIAFRPASHRLWALALIGMHLGIGLFMDIWFIRQITIVALMLACSPFVREDAHALDGLRTLPGFAWLSSPGRQRRARELEQPQAVAVKE